MVFEEIKDKHEELDYIYNLTFDQILIDPRTKYNRDDEKSRIDTQAQPIFKFRFDGILKGYHIKKNQIMCMASKLGLSKLIRDKKVKDCIKIYNGLYLTADDYTLQDISSYKQFHFINRLTKNGRDKYTCYDWVGSSISELSDIIAIHKDSLFVVTYLIGIQSATKIPQQYIETIDVEIKNFWEYISARLEHLESITTKITQNPSQKNTPNVTIIDNSKAKVGISVSGEVGRSPLIRSIDDSINISKSEPTPCGEASSIANNRNDTDYIDVLEFLESHYGFMKDLPDQSDRNYRQRSMVNDIGVKFNIEDSLIKSIVIDFCKQHWSW